MIPLKSIFCVVTVSAFVFIASGCASGDGSGTVHSSTYYGTGYHPHYPYWDDDPDIIVVPPPKLPERPERPIKPPSRPKPPGIRPQQGATEPKK